ncbi:MAG TPA: hypothetical protein VF541_22405 [Longimicrobium sp.]|jgi:hypothetical protein
MGNPQSEHQKLAQVAKEVGAVLRRQARKRWTAVRTADRNEGNRHVWRFQQADGGTERFLHVSHDAMREGDATSVLEQLRAGRCFSRLNGAETSLLLSKGGRLDAYPVH